MENNNSFNYNPFASDEWADFDIKVSSCHERTARVNDFYRAEVALGTTNDEKNLDGVLTISDNFMSGHVKFELMLEDAEGGETVCYAGIPPWLAIRIGTAFLNAGFACMKANEPYGEE